ncbi:MAG TPA: hypothetical protein VK576_01295 [Thermoleophilia bacterium]|nr:hypothetical protein [Thermoleophilia bacterium]
MSLHATTIATILAVKNGPAGVWRALDSSRAGAVGAFLTSPPALAIGACAWLALAVVLYRRARHHRLPGGLVAMTAVTGLLVVAGLATRAPLLGLVVPLLLAGLWIATLWPRDRRGSRSPEHQAQTSDGRAEVVDLARWRERKEAGRKTGSR